MPQQQQQENISQKLLKYCGQNSFQPNSLLLSKPTLELLKKLSNTWYLSILFTIFVGKSPHSFINDYSKIYTLDDAFEVLKSNKKFKPSTLTLGLRFVAKKFLPQRFAKELIGLYTIAESTAYVSNIPLISLCPDFETLFENQLNMQRSVFHTRWFGKYIDQAKVPQKQQHFIGPILFWGNSESLSYPLHVDGIDGDVFIYVMSGCKDVVFLDDAPEGYVDAVDVLKSSYGLSYGLNVFKHREILGIEGYTGRIKAGEVVFFPGGIRHAVKNSCEDTVAFAVRPWGRKFLNENKEKIKQEYLRYF